MTPKQIILLIVVLIMGVLLGFFVGKSNDIEQKISQPPSSPQQTFQPNLFRSQTATFQGEITKVNQDSIDVKTDSGQTGSLVLSSRITIYKFKEGSSQASASSDLNTIEIGKKVLIILELSGNQYRVVSISYQPPPSAVGPTAKPTSQPKRR